MTTYPRLNTPVDRMRSKAKAGQWPELPVVYHNPYEYGEAVPGGGTVFRYATFESNVPPLRFKNVPSGVLLKITTGGRISSEARRHWRRTDHPLRTAWLSFHWHVLRRRPMA